MRTTKDTDEAVEKVYSEIDRAISAIKRGVNLIVMEDSKSVVGKGLDGEEVGAFRPGNRNERDNQFYTQNQHKIPASKKEEVCMESALRQRNIANSLHSIQQQNQVKDRRGHSSPDIDRMVMAECQHKFKTGKETKIMKIYLKK